MKLRFFALAAAVCLVLSGAALAAEGVSVKMVLRPQFDNVSTFDNGYAAVALNGKWGYINESGKWLVQPKYDLACSFHEDVAVVGTLEPWTRYDGYSDPNDLNYRLSLLRTDGTEIPLRRPMFEDNLESLMAVYVPPASVSMSDLVCVNGIINADGTPFRKDGSRVEVTGREHLAEPYDYFRMVGPCVDGVIPMMASHLMQDGASWQAFYMGTDGAITNTFPAHAGETTGGDVHKPGVSVAYAPQNGRIVTQYGWFGDYNAATQSYPWYSRVGVLDPSGKWIVTPAYNTFQYLYDGQYFVDGILIVQSIQEKYGGVDMNGNVVIPTQYDMCTGFSQGFCGVILNGKGFFIDKNNKAYQVAGLNGVTPDIRAVGSFRNGVAPVFDAASRKAYCVWNTPDENGVLPVVPGSEKLGIISYFPAYNGYIPTGILNPVGDTVVIKEGDKWGFAWLSFTRDQDSEKSGAAPVQQDSAEQKDSGTGSAAQAKGFTDVSESAYYHDAVLWAVDRGITAGSTATTFSPDTPCTTAHILTFLYRAQGSPAPGAENPFSDVAEDAYYHDAALWAYEKGLVSGDAFRGGAPCTRAACMGYLWRLAGSPESAPAPFTDVGGEDAGAVSWAVAQGITRGTSETAFSPENICTRGQIVTFLYRAYGQ